MDKLPTIGHEQLLAHIASKCKQPEIYEEMISSLHDLGIDAAFVSLAYRGESGCATKRKSVPTLTIGVKTNENYISLNIDERTNNWDSSYPQTNAIRQIWYDLLVKYNYCVDDTYDKDMLVFFRNVPEWIIVLLAYENRDAIKEAISSLKIVQPKEIYCSSLLGYNVIYSSESDYSAAEKNRQFDRICDLIKNAIELKTPKEYRHYVETLLKIEFYHPNMQGFNWYGFARQD